MNGALTGQNIDLYCLGGVGFFLTFLFYCDISGCFYSAPRESHQISLFPSLSHFRSLQILFLYSKQLARL